MADIPRVLVIQHVPHESSGWFTDVLDEAGVDVEVCYAWEQPLPDDMSGWAGLIVLGGPMGANDDIDVAWLPQVKRLLVEAVERSVPTIGLCLGAQLLAVALGGAVEKGGAGPELGLSTVTVASATGDPLFDGLDGSHDVVQWHWDEIVTLPEGAVLLASSAAYPHQAFRFGDRAWAVLFHPEVTLPLVAQWAQNDKAGVVAAGFDPVTLVGAIADAERSLLETWTPLLERFAALVASDEKSAPTG